MPKTLAKTIADRDLDRLVSVCSETDVEIALNKLVELVKERTTIITYSRIRGYLKEPAFKRRFPNEDMFQRLLSRLHITEGQWGTIEAISQRWSILHDQPLLEYAVAPMVKDIVSFWGAEIKSSPQNRNGLWLFSLKFPEFHLQYFDDDVYLVVVTDPGSGVNQFNAVKEMLIQHGSGLKISLLLVLGDGKSLRELVKSSTIEIVVIGENSTLEILLSRNSRQIFCSHVAGKVSVQVIQPYQTQGKVRTRMFYGRHEELKRLKNNLSSNFAVYGGRLIGKSSLLHQIKLIFEQEELQSYKVCSITAQVSPTIEICRNILKSFDIPTGNHKSLVTFERLMRDYIAEVKAKKLLILIDEVDDLISADEKEDYQIFQIFNNLNNDYGEKCRFVVAGYRDLAKQCMDADSRFRNFGEKIRLGNLSPVTARQLIQEPLCNELSFRFQEESLIDKILEITGCHPNYIQVFCKELSEYLERQKRRRIREEDILATFENQDFRAKIIETFYVNFTSLQQLITSLVIIENKSEVDLTEIVDILSEYSYKDELKNVFVAMRQLEMSFVFEQIGTKYRFVNKLFPEMIEKSVDLYKLVDHLLQGLKEGKR